MFKWNQFENYLGIFEFWEFKFRLSDLELNIFTFDDKNLKLLILGNYEHNRFIYIPQKKNYQLHVQLQVSR